MDDLTNDIELKQLRKDLSLLKNKLSKQVEVNEMQIMQQAKRQMSKLLAQNAFFVAVSIFSVIFCPYVFYHMLDMSLAFVIVTSIFLCCSLGLNLCSFIMLKKVDFASGNLLEVGKRVTKIKLVAKRWQTFGMTFILPWFVWFVVDIIMHAGGMKMLDSYTIIMLVSAFIGGVIGFFIGYSGYKNFIRRSDNILLQIEELTKLE